MIDCLLKSTVCVGCVLEVRPAPLRQDLELQPPAHPVGGRPQCLQQGPRVSRTQVELTDFFFGKFFKCLVSGYTKYTQVGITYVLTGSICKSENISETFTFFSDSLKNKFYFMFCLLNYYFFKIQGNTM